MCFYLFFNTHHLPSVVFCRLSGMSKVKTFTSDLAICVGSLKVAVLCVINWNYSPRMSVIRWKRACYKTWWWSWAIQCSVIFHKLLRLRRSGASAYQRKLQNDLKLSRPRSWNYEPWFVVSCLVTNRLFSCYIN